MVFATTMSCATSLRSHIAQAKDSTVAIRLLVEVHSPTGDTLVPLLAGSGVAIDSDRIVTCVHVVQPLDKRVVQIQVIRDSDWQTGVKSFKVRAYIATVIWHDLSKDLAVLSVPGLGATPAEISDEPLSAGDDTFWLGHPFGGAPHAGAGIVADVGPFQNGVSAYAIDGTVNAGNSGGGLFSRRDGKLVGVISAKQGALSDRLRRFRDQGPRTSEESASLSDLDAAAALRQTLREMGNDIQLGLGYAIGINELPLPDRERQAMLNRLEHEEEAFRFLHGRSSTWFILARSRN